MQTVSAASRPAAPLPDRLESLGLLIHGLSKGWREELDRRLRPLGLTRVQWQALLWLARAGGVLMQRELSDALRRRCLYHYVDYPDVDREARIIMTRIDGAGTSLSLQIARMVEAIRKEELRKVPGVAETLDWARALNHLGTVELDLESSARTLGALVKYRDDATKVQHALDQMLRA